MGVIPKTLVGSMLLAVACAQADQRPAASSQGGMTLGNEDTEGDPTPTTTVPTTGISAGSNDHDDGSVTDADDTSTGDSTTMEADSTTSGSTSDTSGTSTGEASTEEATSNSGDVTTGDESTSGEVTDGETSAGGCNHPPGVYGNCLSNGFSACMNTDAVCIHDDVMTPTVGVCSLVDCVDTCDCPQAPPTGNAQVVCSPLLPDNQTACILACGPATTCPTGMTCWANTLCVFQ